MTNTWQIKLQYVLDQKSLSSNCYGQGYDFLNFGDINWRLSIFKKYLAQSTEQSFHWESGLSAGWKKAHLGIL